MQNEEFVSISQNETRHWWYRNLHQLTFMHLQINGLGAEAHILDAACGTGGLMMYLQERGYTHLKGFDRSDLAVNIAGNRDLPVVKGDLKDLDGAFPGMRFDAIICHDAFYFLDEKEQRKFLRDCSELLNKGGILMMNIPALKSFSGPHDKVVGIENRLNRAQLKRLIDPRLFEWQSCRYWPFLLSPLILLIRWIQRLKTAWFTTTPVSDLKQESFWLNRLLEFITAIETKYIPWTPFGSSLFVVLRCNL